MSARGFLARDRRPASLLGATLTGNVTANSGVLYFADLVNKRVIDLSDPTIADMVVIASLLLPALVDNLGFLRTQAERIDPRLIDAWPRDNRTDRSRFEKLKEAYVKAIGTGFRREPDSFAVTLDGALAGHAVAAFRDSFGSHVKVSFVTGAVTAGGTALFRAARPGFGFRPALR